MDFLKKNKMAIGGGIVLLLGGYIYFMYFSGGSSTPALTSDTTSAISQNLLVTLQNLHTIKLDNTIFTDPIFVSLTDFGVTIPPESVGRRNPFLPLASTGSSNTSIKLPPTR